MGPASRLARVLLVAVAICLVATSGATEGRQPHRASRCTAQATLTCEELVALGYAYPYAREPGPYLFVNGAAYPYVDPLTEPLMQAPVQVGSAVITTAKLLESLGLAKHVLRARTPVIGYGSNAAVSALTRKYVDPRVGEPAVIPVTRARLRDYDVVWSPHLVFNGAMPATIVPSPGTVVEVWITWLDDRELARMHETEGAGAVYAYGTLAPARLDSDVALPGPAHVYVDCAGGLVLDGALRAIAAVPAAGRRFPALDSEHAMQGVAPLIGWTGSVFALLLDNVRSPGRSAERTQTLAVLGRILGDANYHVDCPCGAESCPVP